MMIVMSDHLRDPQLDQLVRSLNEPNVYQESSGAGSDLAFEPDIQEELEALRPLKLRLPSQAVVAEGGRSTGYSPRSSSRKRATCC